MSDQTSRSVRLRYTATGALAALAAAGAIAGTVALADPSPAAKAPCQPAATSGPGKTGASKPSASPQPFLNAVQQLVGNGTITAAEGQTLDREIVSGRVDTDTLASAGFTPAQLDAVQQALGNVKQGIAAAAAQ
ncbi:MAG TPA: hypothetical protein VMG37_05515 [Solirubrobacteraceae bacterium]|nr:hypothetical protein [Solirubrobacteraceae bacterium]HUA04602.1 hypothetical protein [Solirubrobacteraceae bacterium]